MTLGVSVVLLCTVVVTGESGNETRTVSHDPRSLLPFLILHCGTQFFQSDSESEKSKPTM